MPDEGEPASGIKEVPGGRVGRPLKYPAHCFLENTMSPELEEILYNTFTLRRSLSQILPKEAVDYIIELIVKDGAHRNFLKLTEE